VKAYSNGKVKGISVGKSIITATSASGKNASCIITVVRGVKTPLASTIKPVKLSRKKSPNYRYGFGNVNEDFFKSSVKEKNRVYTMTTDDQSKLVNNLWGKYADYYKNNYGYSTSSDLSTAIKNRSKEKWGGSCFGMSATTILNRKEKIKVRAHANMGLKTKGYGLKDVPKPRNNASTKSIINYYQLSGEEMWSVNMNKGLTLFGTSDNPRSSGYKKIYKHAMKKHAVILAFTATMGDGKDFSHAIIVLSDKPNTTAKNPGYYYFDTYDPSYDWRNTYIRIKDDFSTMDFGYLGPLNGEHENSMWGPVSAFKYRVDLDKFDFLKNG
jgi:hypothetical protein